MPDDFPGLQPTGFPFKVAQLEGSLSESETYESRRRICDTGGLRVPYKRSDGSVGYRCPAEPVEHYIKEGGRIEDTVGRLCMCNGLISTAGFPNTEKPVISSRQLSQSVMIYASGNSC